MRFEIGTDQNKLYQGLK